MNHKIGFVFSNRVCRKTTGFMNNDSLFAIYQFFILN
jgi:hypothetical protein